MSEMDPKPENNKYIQNGPPEIPEEFWGTVSYYLQRLRVKVKFYLRKVVPAVSREERSKVQVDLREESKPDFDYFVLVFLSCTIATLGLLIDSPATIIGAMLVAPLMSPILGIGLASIRGDTTLLTDAVKALLQGALLAIVLSTRYSARSFGSYSTFSDRLRRRFGGWIGSDLCIGSATALGSIAGCCNCDRFDAPLMCSGCGDRVGRLVRGCGCILVIRH